MAQYIPGLGERAAPKTELELRPPSLYKVLMHNDHYTTMDFVVSVVQRVFHKPIEQAVRIMLSVHQNGIGQCGVYTSEIAETKVATVHCLARKQGYPLRCSMEPE
ncbi:MAG: ATP-dependent Clp protease adapter ClpS [Candidatus Hydrogenedentes bacterium]|nr:ATP-dependent Clp protease adapter ClpS [Candidatus Hydrogenedentota bacterium]